MFQIYSSSVKKKSGVPPISNEESFHAPAPLGDTTVTESKAYMFWSYACIYFYFSNFSVKKKPGVAPISNEESFHAPAPRGDTTVTEAKNDMEELLSQYLPQKQEQGTKHIKKHIEIEK